MSDDEIRDALAFAMGIDPAAAPDWPHDPATLPGIEDFMRSRALNREYLAAILAGQDGTPRGHCLAALEVLGR